MNTYEFTITESYNEKARKVRHTGDELVFPAPDGKTYFKVIARIEGKSHLIYAVDANRVHEVRTIDPDEPMAAPTDEQPTEDVHWTEHNAVVADLRRAIKHLEKTLPTTDCAWIDGSVLESGVRTCMTHNRPGRTPGTCAVAQAHLFLEDRDDDKG
jgi:hypothetical protein